MAKDLEKDLEVEENMKIKNGNYRVVKTKRNRSSRFSYKKDNRF